MFRKFISVDL